MEYFIKLIYSSNNKDVNHNSYSRTYYQISCQNSLAFHAFIIMINNYVQNLNMILILHHLTFFY